MGEVSLGFFLLGEGHECPMSFPFRSLLNPCFYCFDFRLGQFLFKLRWRHNLIRIIGGDSVPCFAVVQAISHKCSHTFFLFECFLLQVKSQICLAGFFRGSMAKKTFARKDWANVAIKLNRFGLTECTKRQGEKKRDC